jgi:hypothetical protein
MMQLKPMEILGKLTKSLVISYVKTRKTHHGQRNYLQNFLAKYKYIATVRF